MGTCITELDVLELHGAESHITLENDEKATGDRKPCYDGDINLPVKGSDLYKFTLKGFSIATTEQDCYRVRIAAKIQMGASFLSR